MAKQPKNQLETLPTTFQTMLSRAVATLQVIHRQTGVEFLIYSPKHGIQEGTIQPPKMPKGSTKKTRVRSYLPLGTLINYYLPLIENMQPDELIQIPVLDFNIESLQSSIVSKGGQMWGRGTVTCVQSPDKKTVEVWRLPEGFDRSSLLGIHHRATANELSEDAG